MYIYRYIYGMKREREGMRRGCGRKPQRVESSRGEEYNIDRISVAADSIYPLLTGLLLRPRPFSCASALSGVKFTG